MEFLTPAVAKVPVAMKTDVVVVGGGPAGVGAAIRAAKNGASTALIERFGSLGGSNTNGFMFIVGAERLGEGVGAEICNRLKNGGYLKDVEEMYPGIGANPLIHYNARIPVDGIPKTKRSSYAAFDPDMCACIMNDLMEENGVSVLLRSLFVDAIVENGSIKAVIVENASGKQAIMAKAVVDATGRGDVVARAGAPFKPPANELGNPMPPGLMWRMGGVDFAKFFAYQKEDPRLDKLVKKAISRGELPYYRPKKTEAEMKQYDLTYTGHPHLEMMPSLYPGDILLWEPAIHDWALDCAQKAEDLTRAEVHIRKQIVSELNFIKKYVPGFEKAHLAGIAPFMGIREGRHPVGEYVLTFEDMTKSRTFADAAINRKAFNLPGNPAFDIPYRCFLAKGLDNLLLSGDAISVDHNVFLQTRGFGPSVRYGEIAGTAAALSVKNGVKPNQYKWGKPMLSDR